MERDIAIFQIISEFLYIVFDIVIIVFSFKLVSETKELRDLKIKTSFSSHDTTFEYNLTKDSIKEINEINIYETFFNKYNLTEGNSFKDNKDLSNSFNSLRRINLSIGIISIIFILPSIIFCPCLMICGKGGHGLVADGCLIIFLIAMGVRVLGLIVLLSILIGFFVGFKNEFGNDFYEFSDNIYDTINEGYDLFKEYYSGLFDIKKYCIINFVFLALSIAIFLVVVFCFIIKNCRKNTIIKK